MSKPNVQYLQVGDDARAVLEQAGVGALVGQKNVVLYFYPHDFTPGCTREARDFRDAQAEFDALNTEIVGVSTDSGARHEKFTEKYALTFTLVSDPKAQLAGLCGAQGALGMTSRTTLLIDRAGKVRYIWAKVKVGGHAADVLARVRELSPA